MQLLRHGSLSQCKERLYRTIAAPPPPPSSSSSSSVAPSLSLVPILTPPIVDDCRYVLVPESRRIVVRKKHGLAVVNESRFSFLFLWAHAKTEPTKNPFARREETRLAVVSVPSEKFPDGFEQSDSRI